MLTPQIGKTYIVKHSSGMIRAKFIREAVYNPHFNSNRLFDRRSTTHYIFENLESGRTIEIKSRVKIRREVS
ncbi:MAG: hypothetical protein KGI50_07760 [Patescibacteria group bacterium]|nr:hypothetical protein [Patescibacteria group bacterium]